VTGVVDSGTAGSFDLSGYVTEVPSSTTFKLASGVISETYSSGGTASVPYQITTPWAIADLDGIGTVQSADTMYLFHKRYHPRRIERTGTDVFRIVGHELDQGPYVEAQSSLDWSLWDDAVTTALWPSEYKNMQNNNDYGGYRRGEFVQIIAHGGSSDLAWRGSTPGSSNFESLRIGQIFKFRKDTSRGFVVAQIVSVYGLSLAIAVIISNGAETDGSDWDFTYSTAADKVESATDPENDAIFLGEFYGAIMNTSHAVKTVTSVTDTGTHLRITTQERHCIDQASPTSESVTLAGFYAGTSGGPSINGTYTVSSVISDTVFEVAYSETTNADILATNADTTATFTPFLENTDQEGGQYCNFPSLGEFFQQRLWVANSADNPNKIWGSATGEFANFRPSSVAAGSTSTVLDTDAIKITIDSNEVNAVRWLESAARGLIVGTEGLEHALSGETTFEVVTPSNVRTFKQTNHGSISGRIKAAVDRSILFVHRSAKKLIELVYSFDADQQVGTDVSLVSEHVLRAGVKQIVRQESPVQFVWAVLDDGSLTCLTFEREQEVVGWSTCSLGGSGLVKSMSVIPETENDAVYVSVQRGSDVFIEILQDPIDIEDEQRDAWYVDSGLKYDGVNTGSETLTFNGTYTVGGSGTLTASTATFAGDSSDVDKRYRLYDSDGNWYDLKITAASTTTSCTAEVEVADIPASLQNTATASWAALASTVTGLDHLNGQTVKIWADGTIHAEKTVSSGSVSLDDQHAVVIVGYGYTTTLESLPVRVLQYSAEPRGKVKGIYNAEINLWRSLGGTITFDGNTEPIDYSRDSDSDVYPRELATRLVEVCPSSSYNSEQTLTMTTSDPAPFNLLAITYELDINDAV